jgi:nucleotide sugar dehydrogenase
VNIALVNEFAKLCNSLDIDVWDVIRAASTKPFGFQPFFPGIGVGGHCIPIDPSYLAYKLKEEKGEDFEFISLAQRLSSEMPGYVAKRVRDAYLKESNEKNIKGSKIVVFGVSYKPNSSDIRETPANDLISALTGYGFSVYFVDPNVESFEVDGTKIPKLELSDLLDNRFDVIVVAQAHEEFIQGNKVFWPNVKSLVFDATGKIELEGSRIVRL